MKKKEFTLVFVLMAIFSGGLQAQTSIILNPEIGIQFSKLDPSGDLDLADQWPQDVSYSSIFTYQAGINTGIQFSGNWALITGLKFNRKGGEATIETRDPSNPFPVIQSDGTVVGDLGKITITNVQNWLSIPILARAQFGRSFKVGLAIGPQINIGIGEYSETTEYELENTNLSSDEETAEFGTSSNNLFKKTHVSLFISPYVSYQLNNNSSVKFSLMIERSADMMNENYVVGDTDLNGQPIARNVNGSLKNNQFGFMLGYEHTFDLNVGVKY